MDKYSAIRITTLHPKAIPVFTLFLNACEQEGIILRITADGGYRDFTEQSKLYNQGRTTPGDIVTNAMAGQSYHNYGVAIDCAQVNGDGSVAWDYKAYQKCAEIGKQFGIVWGGSWAGHLADNDHYELSFGYTFEQLLALHNTGKVDEKGYVILDNA